MNKLTMLQIRRTVLNQELDYLAGSIKNLELQMAYPRTHRDHKHDSWVQKKLNEKLKEQDELLNESAELELLEAPMEET